MSEGRKSQVLLPDDRRLEILIQPKLYAGELLDLVSSHFNLKEKEFFGLSFKDESGHYHWLQLDRKVLEHDFPKKAGQLILNFAVRFFIESIAYLRDKATIELFYLQAKQYVAKGIIETDSEEAFELAGYALQATFSDFTDEETAKKQLKKLPLLPNSTIKDHPSLSFCEDKVIDYYQKAAGLSRGAAIVNYMALVEKLPTYGIHYYEVKDKAGIPWWLGLSHKSIAQFDFNDKKTPRREFAWKQLENLYFRDKKFSIEVHDPKRVSVSRRTFGPGNVNVHAWFTRDPLLTKCIWSMAVSQHQFYLDRKQSKTQIPVVRSLGEIAMDLSQSTSSLPSSASGDISRSNSAHSLSLSLSTSNVKFDVSQSDLEDPQLAQRDMFAALKARKEALEEALQRKTEELKALCLKEAELTGELPVDTPLMPGETPPQIRRRMGTEFSLSPNILNWDQVAEDEELIAKLELELEIQDKICKAAQKLAHDVNVSKSVRKQRRQSYHKAHQKLKELEQKVNEARHYQGQAHIHQHPSLEDLLSEDSTECIDSESEFISPVNSPVMPHTNRIQGQQAPPQVKIITSPKVEVVELEHPGLHGISPASQSSVHPLTVRSPPHQNTIEGHETNSNMPIQHSGQGGYRPNAVYSTRTQYRSQTYPTFSQTYNQSPASEYDNIMNPDTPHNLYNVYTQQTRRYDSCDELKTPSENCDLYNEEDPQLTYPYKHGSLEGVYQYHQQDLSRYEGHLPTDGDIVLPQLTPSRFGSKRESTVDSHDSCYQLQEMSSVPGPDREGAFGSHGNSLYSCIPSSQGSGMGMSYPYTGYDENRAHLPLQYPTGSGNNAYGQALYYGERGSTLPSVRQQPPPHTPQYEVPPTSFIQQPSPGTQSPAAESPQQQVMTVTKYQSYVEVSKPFETADVYRYSEKLRRQRNVQLRQQKLEAVLSGREGTSKDVNLSYVPYPVPGVPSHLSSPGTVSPGQIQGRPSSPYSVGSGSQSSRSSRPNSPYSHMTVGSPGPLGAGGSTGYPQCAGHVPGHIIQNENSSPAGHYPTNPHSHQQQLAYQPPQPMSCEPISDKSPAVTSPQSPHRIV